jgi:hypothetical protein
MLKYTHVTQNIYIQSWTVTKIMARNFETLTAVTYLLIIKYILKWQEYVVSVMLISVRNIKVTCEWHKAIKLNYKKSALTS